MSRITLTSVRYDKALTQDSLNKCRDHRSKLRDEVDYLQKDIYAYKRRLERAYRPRVVMASRKEPDIKDIGTFKLYPRGVTHPPTWTYPRTWAYGEDRDWELFTRKDILIVINGTRFCCKPINCPHPRTTVNITTTETPAAMNVPYNPVVSKTIFSSDGSVRHIYTVQSEVY